MSVLDFIRRQILRYRDLLANLSRRNKELYYRESRGHCINLSKNPKVDEEFDDLILEKFVPLRTMMPRFQELLNESVLDLSKHFLLDETNNADLIKRLDKVRLADDKFQREYGISGAWLLGPFLCWRDTTTYKPEDFLISPVFKIAVDITKDKRKRWSLKLEDNSLQLNSSLRLALRQKWGIQLPERFESDQVSDALEELKRYLEDAGKTLSIENSFSDALPKIPPRFKIVKDEQGEIIDRIPVNIEEVLSKKEYELYNKVTNNQFYLIDIVLIDHLNASRTVLLRDYDSILEETEMHPILSELFLGKPIPNDRGDDHERIKMLDGYKEKENHFVVNIDSSQHRAIDQTTKSQVVVIQGPPGTGKSQTITNLIAEALAKGKKVLFVSEKRAALDVVYSRLQQANLVSQAVLIHSSDLNKQNLYNSFLELSDSVHDTSTDQQWDLITDEFDKLKAEINNYYRVLESKHNPSGLSISDLLSIYAQFAVDKVNIALAKQFSECSFADLQQSCSILDELQDKVKKVPNFPTHPWLYRKKDTILTTSFSQSITDLIDKIKQSEKTVNELEKKIIDLGINNIDSIPSASVLDEIIKSTIPPEWMSFSNLFYSDQAGLPIYQKEIDEIIKIIESEKLYFDQIKLDADIELVRQLESYYSLKHGLVDWCSPTFWRMRNYRCQYLQSKWDGTNKAFKAYRLVCEAIKSFKAITQNKLIPVALEEANPQLVIDTCQTIIPIIKIVSETGAIVKNLGLLSQAKFINYTAESSGEIKKLILEISHLKSDLEKNINILGQYKNELYNYFERSPQLEIKNNDFFPYDLLIQTIDDLELLDKVDLCLENLRLNIKTDFSKQILVDNLVSIESPWGSYVLSLVMKWWLDESITQNPELRNFDKDVFHKKIEQFKRIEDSHRHSARDFVNNTFSKRWKKGIGEFEGLSLLKREANKQRKVLPPREIMEKGALSTMLKLKPCWLMSPLSISQVLPIQMGLFDIIIFDEASQVRVEDAVPSIYRASSMVVVGDPKQMPPTNFFSASEFIDDDDDDNEAELTASILDLASQIYPSEILEWHYRSRSESLIAFSNRAFYGGRLIAVPNPYFITEGDVIKFHKIKDAYFSQKNGNVVEAGVVVNRLAELLKMIPNKSFGIIAMGQSQMLAIEDAIERKQLSDINFKNDIERARNYFDGEADASFFIKNLENVQGDERDIILISVGYAPSSPGKKVYMNFGPLSKQGGGRRLNVAITRAKQKIEVFCSFDPNQIPTEEKDFGKNPDLVLFGRYLKYANAISEKNYLDAKAILESFGVGGAITTRKSSNFSKDVHRRLEDLGYKISPEIGSSGFYIDLGVHHPVIPSNFILGIECDGALFHSTPYARDRDKIRQELLESRGWKIARVWSQDWSKDWKSEVTKLDALIKKIISE
ncbi:MAG TPA: AAA domain-containing protein [Gammaproteobacteria bacterium]|nr:AAA domain-containing protein [Gammaproteobacteria bacterium]